MWYCEGMTYKGKTVVLWRSDSRRDAAIAIVFLSLGALCVLLDKIT